MGKFNIIFEPPAKYLIAAVLIIVPLFPKFPLIRIPGTYVAIRFEDLLLMFLGALTIIKVLPNLSHFLRDKIVQAFLIFSGIGLVSLLTGKFLTQTLDFPIGFLHWARRIEYAVPFFAALVLVQKEKLRDNLDFYIKVLLIVVGVAFVYGLGQRYLNFPIIITQNEEYSKGIALRYTPGAHINSTFAGHYDLAAFMVLVLPAFLVLLVLLRDKVSRLVILITSISGTWLLINTISRIGQVGYFVAVFIALSLVKKFKALVIILLVSMVLAGMSGSLDARFRQVINVYYEKIRHSFIVNAQEQTIPARKIEAVAPTPTPPPLFEDRSTSIRLNVEWPRAIRAFMKNPFFGTGYSSIGLAVDNDYLRMLGETGLLGAIALFLVFLRIGLVFVKNVPSLIRGSSEIEQAFIAGVVGSGVGIFVIAFFIDILEASKFATVFWLLLGYAVSILRNKRDV